MFKKPFHIDYFLAGAVAVLLILGILVLASVSAVFSQESFETTTYYLFHQLIYGLGFGLLAGFAAFIVPLSYLKKWALVFILINLLLMVLIFIPGLGVTSGGASRWIDFKIFKFQPSEFLKLTFVIYLATLLASRTEKLKDRKSLKLVLLPFLFVLGLIAFLLIVQSDASTLALIVTVGILIYFLANTPLWHTCLFLFIGLGLFGCLIKFSSYRINRILIYLGIMDDPMGKGYQIKQALITIGSGGIAGLGIGESSQKFGGLLPQTMSDSIFAIFAEETGFIGSFALIFFFLVFAWRCFIIAKNSPDRFSQLFAVGISCWICIQAFVNIGSMINIIPLTGIPLPLIGYGGSHIVAELIGVGILLNISKHIKK